MPSGAYKLINPSMPFTPAPYGLDTAVNWLIPESPHWQGGVMWEPICAEANTTLNPCVTGAGGLTPALKAETFEYLLRGARPFTVYTEVDCSTPGMWEKFQDYAVTGLTRSELAQLERTFWTGDAGGISDVVLPNLTASGPVSDGQVLLQLNSVGVTGVALDVVEGLGRLEQTLADCWDGAGVIHVPRLLIPALCAQNQIIERGGRYLTWNGNQIVAGGGYPASIGPGGVVAPVGTGWMFATSPIFGYRGQINSTPRVSALNRAVNTVKMIAERTVLLGWECCLAGVLVTAGGEPAGVYNSTT